MITKIRPLLLQQMFGICRTTRRRWEDMGFLPPAVEVNPCHRWWPLDQLGLKLGKALVSAVLPGSGEVLLTASQVARCAGMTPHRFLDLVRTDRAPQPWRVGDKWMRWRGTVIKQWLAERRGEKIA